MYIVLQKAGELPVYTVKPEGKDGPVCTLHHDAPTLRLSTCNNFDTLVSTTTFSLATEDKTVPLMRVKKRNVLAQRMCLSRHVSLLLPKNLMCSSQSMRLRNQTLV